MDMDKSMNWIKRWGWCQYRWIEGKTYAQIYTLSIQAKELGMGNIFKIKLF